MNRGFSRNGYLITLLLCACAVAAGAHYSQTVNQIRPRGDFISYWSAMQIVVGGGNPYDFASMQAVQRQVFPQVDTPVLMWNSPILLLILAPILMLPYSAGAILFDALSILSILLCSTHLLAGKGVIPVRTGLFIPVCALSFTPFIPAWSFGQSSFVVLVGVTLMLRAFDGLRVNPLLLALGIICTSVKPHLALGAYAALLFLLLRQRSRSVLLTSAGLVGALYCILWTIWPTVLIDWVGFHIEGAEGARQTFNYKPASLMYVVVEFLVRMESSAFSSREWVKLLSLVIWLPVSVGGAWIAVRRLVTSRHAIAFSTVVGLLFVPHAWPTDLIVGLPLYCFAVGPLLGSSDGEKLRSFMSFLIMSVSTVLSTSLTYSQSFFYVGALTLILYCWVKSESPGKRAAG